MLLIIILTSENHNRASARGNGLPKDHTYQVYNPVLAHVTCCFLFLPPLLVCKCTYDSSRSSGGFSVFLTGGNVEALEVTKETPGQGAFKPNSISEETYDDVENSRRQG